MLTVRMGFLGLQYRNYPSSIMRYFKENVAIYCKPTAIQSIENADELLLVLTMSFQLDEQKIAFNSMSPEKDSSFLYTQ